MSSCAFESSGGGGRSGVRARSARPLPRAEGKKSDAATFGRSGVRVGGRVGEGEATHGQRRDVHLAACAPAGLARPPDRKRLRVARRALPEPRRGRRVHPARGAVHTPSPPSSRERRRPHFRTTRRPRLALRPRRGSNAPSARTRPVPRPLHPEPEPAPAPALPATPRVGMRTAARRHPKRGRRKKDRDATSAERLSSLAGRIEGLRTLETGSTARYQRINKYLPGSPTERRAAKVKFVTPGTQLSSRVFESPACLHPSREPAGRRRGDARARAQRTRPRSRPSSTYGHARRLGDDAVHGGRDAHALRAQGGSRAGGRARGRAASATDAGARGGTARARRPSATGTTRRAPSSRSSDASTRRAASARRSRRASRRTPSAPSDSARTSSRSRRP